MLSKKTTFAWLFLVISVCVLYVSIGHSSVQAATADDSTVIELLVEGCNNNLICELFLGETVSSCPSDCTATTTPPTPTTTPSVAPQPPAEPGPGGTYKWPIVFENFKIEASTTTAIVSWTTPAKTLSTVSWGTDPDTSAGNVTETDLRNIHNILLTNLLPDTLYYVTVRASDGFGQSAQVTYAFRTKSLFDRTPPSNITDFRAELSFGGNILLTWKNPRDEDFDFVRIRRGTRYYPRDPQEGYFVYEGRGQQALDSNAFSNMHYFYTAFARDRFGNYSSGAVTDFIFYDSSGNNFGSLPLFGGNTISTSTTATESILFFQNGARIFGSRQNFSINNQQAVIVRVPKSVIPKNTEQSYIRIIEKGNINTFLFRKHSDGYLEVVVPASLTSGDSFFDIVFLSRGSETHVPGMFISSSNLVGQGSLKNRQIIFFIGLFLLIYLIILFIGIYVIVRIFIREKTQKLY